MWNEKSKVGALTKDLLFHNQSKYDRSLRGVSVNIGNLRQYYLRIDKSNA